MPQLKLNKAKRDEEARWSQDRRTELENRVEFGSLATSWRNAEIAWRGRIPRANKPWDNASEFNPPLIYSKGSDLHAILHGYVSGMDFFSIRPAERGNATVENVMRRAEDWDNVLKWSMRNQSNTIGFWDLLIHNGVLFGHGFGEISYLRDVRTIEAEVFVPDDVRKGGGTDWDIVQRTLGKNLFTKSPRKEGDRFKIRFIDEDGVEKDGQAYVDRNNPNRQQDEVSVTIIREQVLYDAPKPILINPWDIVIPGNTTDLQTAKYYFVRRYYTIHQIRAMKTNGLFNALSDGDMAELVERLEKDTQHGGLGSVSDQSTSGSYGHDDVDSWRDSEVAGNHLESRKDEFECWFEYSYEDLDRDGVAESVVRCIINPQSTPLLAMRHRIEYLYPHAKRPHFDWKLIPVPGRYYGMGIAELLYDCQTEENAFYQKRSDVLQIITTPTGFYDPLSGIAPDAIHTVPGMLIKARLSDGHAPYMPFNFAVDPMPLFNEQTGIELQAERAVGSTDMGLGRSPGRPNAPRTLGGTAIVVRQQQLRTNVYLQRLLLGSGPCPGGISEYIAQYRELMHAFMPSKVSFRVAGTDELRTVTRDQLQGRFDHVVDFSEEQNNPQLRMQNTILGYDRAVLNPLVAQDPEALWHITTRFLESVGQKDAKRWVRKPTPTSGRPPLEPMEVIYTLSRGIRIRPLPSENHQEFLSVVTDIMSDQEKLAEHFTAQTIPLLNDYVEESMRYMMAGVTSLANAAQQNGKPNNAQSMGGGVMQEQVAAPMGGGAEV